MRHLRMYIQNDLPIFYKALENFCQRKYTPLYEKGIKLNQNKPMETTCFLETEQIQVCSELCAIIGF